MSGKKKLGFGHKSSSQFMGDRQVSFNNQKPPIDKVIPMPQQAQKPK